MIANIDVGFGTSGIRGLVSEMSDSVCYAFAQAFLQVYCERVGKPHQVVIGHDLRPSSPRIAAACASACNDAGMPVIYVGALPTPALACYAKYCHAPAIMVTGSHIPFDRNGIKFYRASGEISKADEQAIQQASVDLPLTVACRQLPALDKRALDLYVQRYVSFFGAGTLKGMRVAFYEHSSVAREAIHAIFGMLGAELISIGRSDSFVPIDTEAVRLEDVEQARYWAQQYNFDAIISTDGDADRPLIGDEKGEWLRGDVVGILVARFLAANQVVTPVSSNTALEQSGWFNTVIRTRIGSPYVIMAMDELISKSFGVTVGYEANGGFLLGNDVVRNNRELSALPTRDAVLPMLVLLIMMKEARCKLSELETELPQRFTASGRLQEFSTINSAQLLKNLRNNHQFAAQLMAPSSGMLINVDDTDGLRMQFGNGDIVHLRPSGNAPELRCYAEAATVDAAKTLCENCLQRIKTHLQI